MFDHHITKRTLFGFFSFLQNWNMQRLATMRCRKPFVTAAWRDSAEGKCGFASSESEDDIDQ